MKAIISVLGGDRPGIIAEISGCLYRHNLNILDITQTIMKEEVFVMLALVDIAEANVPFHEVREGLSELGQSMGVSIRIQREDIFNSMHKV